MTGFEDIDAWKSDADELDRILWQRDRAMIDVLLEIDSGLLKHEIHFAERMSKRLGGKPIHKDPETGLVRVGPPMTDGQRKQADRILDRYRG